jgi:hypothetical protein
MGLIYLRPKYIDKQGIEQDVMAVGDQYFLKDTVSDVTIRQLLDLSAKAWDKIKKSTTPKETSLISNELHLEVKLILEDNKESLKKYSTPNYNTLNDVENFEMSGKYLNYLVYSRFDKTNQCYMLCEDSRDFQKQGYSRLGYSIPFWKIKEAVEENNYTDIQFICSTYENKVIKHSDENSCYYNKCSGSSIRPRIYNDTCNKNLELFSILLDRPKNEKYSAESYFKLINQYNLIAAYNERYKNKFLDIEYEEKRHYDEINSFLNCDNVSEDSLGIYSSLLKHGISISDANIANCILQLDYNNFDSNSIVYNKYQELLLYLLSHYKFEAYSWDSDQLIGYTIDVEPHGTSIAKILISFGVKVYKYDVYNAISVIKKCTDNENTLSLINLLIKNKPKDLEYVDIFSHILDKVRNLNEDKHECTLDIYLGIIRNFKLIKFVNKITKLKKETDIGYRLKKFLDCEFFSSFTTIQIKLYQELIDLGIEFTQQNIESCIPKLEMHQNILEKILQKSEYSGNKLRHYKYYNDPEPDNLLMHLTARSYSEATIEDLLRKGAIPNAEAIYNAIKHYDSIVIKDIIEALPNKLNTNGEYEYVVSGGKAITTALSRICEYLDVAKNLYCTSGNIHGFADFQLPTTSYGSHGISYYREYFFHNGNCNSPIYNEESEYINSALLEIINILNLLFDYGMKAEEGIRSSFMHIELSKSHRIHVLGKSIPLYDLSEYSEKILDLILEHYNPGLMDLSYTILRCLYSSNKCINFFTKTLNKLSLTANIGQVEQILVSLSKEDDSCVNEENRLFMVEKVLDKFITQYSFDKENKSEIINYISSFMLLAFKESNIIVEEYIKKYFLSYLAESNVQINKDIILNYLLLCIKDGKNYIGEICSISHCDINFFHSFSEEYFIINTFGDIFITPLELAVINNNYGLVKSLLTNKANANPYHYERLSNHVVDITEYQNWTSIFTNSYYYEPRDKKKSDIIKISDYYKSYFFYSNDIVGCFLKANMQEIALKHNNEDMLNLLLNYGVSSNECKYSYVCSSYKMKGFIAIELQAVNTECADHVKILSETCNEVNDVSTYDSLKEILKYYKDEFCCTNTPDAFWHC